MHSSVKILTDEDGPVIKIEKILNRPKKVIIENNVWIGANTFVLSGVRIGLGTVISANSVVVNDTSYGFCRWKVLR